MNEVIVKGFFAPFKLAQKTGQVMDLPIVEDFRVRPKGGDGPGKNKYQKTKEKVIDLLIDLDDVDPVRYAFKVRELINDLRAIRTLIGEVEKDANRRV